MENTTVNEGKTAAIISHITIIGTIIAFVMNNTSKNSFASFHIRQNLGLNLLWITNSYVLGKVLGFGMVAGIIGLGIFVLWIIGLIGAIQGEEKKIPLLGDQFQDWFKTI